MTEFEQDLITKINAEVQRIGKGFIEIGLKVSDNRIVKVEFGVKESVEIPSK